MGYFSQVVIIVNGKNVEQVRPALEKLMPDEIVPLKGWHIFRWNAIVWDDDLPEMIEIQNALDQLPLGSYSFIRIGADFDDVILDGAYHSDLIDITTTIHIRRPEPEYLLVSDLGFWNPHGWVLDTSLAYRYKKPVNLPLQEGCRWINTANEAVIFISKDQAGYLQWLLDQAEIDFDAENIPEDATLATFTARFSNGYEADIKVCSGQNNCFVDPVLFNEKGGEITVLDVEGELLGFYDFGDYKLELKPILQKIR